MKFLYPLGLLGLIGVPLVILIYILKNKYNEQTVPSTFLWTLSEKFFKKRNPLSGLTGIISLILQILTVAFVSFAIARPVFIIPEAAEEYCFILDCSGSMNTKNGDKTRFEEAKEQIEELIDESSNGSTYTLITLNAEPSAVYERITDKKMATEMLYDQVCTDGLVEEGDALALAQGYFDENTSFVTYFFTDSAYTEHNNVKIVNLGLQSARNYSVNNITSDFTDGTLNVFAEVRSYSSNETLTVGLFVNGSAEAADTVRVDVWSDEIAQVELSCDVASYDYFRVSVLEEDALMQDNSIVIYNLESAAAYDILLVSETPFFMEAALDVLTDSKVDVISPEKYNGQTGYGLYIFHSYTPSVLPDAAVWLINSTESVSDSGFGIRGVIELEEPGEIVKSNSTASAARDLLSGINGNGIYISEYVKYSGMYTKFTTLFSYDSNPLIFAGTNALGNREVVVGFDLHKADFSLSTDFVPLVGALLSYSCPDILDRTDFVCGEDVSLNLSSNMLNVKGISPDGKEIYIDSSTDIGVLHLDKVGTYTVRVTTADSVQDYKIYSATPEKESDSSVIKSFFSLAGEQTFVKSDGEYDPIVIIFITLAVLFMADWMVYCYEKYQLR